MSLDRRIKQRYQASHEPKSMDAAKFCRQLNIETRKPLKPVRYHNPGKRALWIGVGVAATAILIVPMGLFLAASLRSKDELRLDNIRYSLHDAKVIEKQTFKALNGITYEQQAFQLATVTDEYRNAVNSFASALHANLNPKENIVYSPLAAYIGLDLTSFAANEDTQGIYASVIGSSAMRNSQYSSMLRTNFYADELGSAQIYNGMFFNVDQGYKAKQGYVDFLTRRKAEAYEASFQNDLRQIADWGNQRAGEKMLSPESFTVSHDSVLMSLSLLSFEGKWSNPFLREETKDKTFHKLDGSGANTPFMTHTCYGYYAKDMNEILPYHGAYEYDRYYSVYDEYQHGYTVQYLVPKEEQDSIFAVLDGVDFLIEDPSRYFFMPHEGDDRNTLYQVRRGVIEYNVPRFETKSVTDLEEAMKGIGLRGLFEGIDGDGLLSEAIDFQGVHIDVSWIEEAKQISSIQFNEDGTLAKTFYIQTMAGATSAGPMSTGLRLTLDQPFVYVIRDPNGLPLYIGVMTDPTK